MAVPKKILSLVDLGAGSRVQVSVENGRVIIEPRKKPRYTLGELLSRYRRSDLAPQRGDPSGSGRASRKVKRSPPVRLPGAAAGRPRV